MEIFVNIIMVSVVLWQTVILTELQQKNKNLNTLLDESIKILENEQKNTIPLIKFSITAIHNEAIKREDYEEAQRCLKILNEIEAIKQ